MSARFSCEGSGSFGNGVEVSAINEAGGREVPIYDELTAQVRLCDGDVPPPDGDGRMVANTWLPVRLREKTSSRGYIGKSASVVNTVSLVDVRIGACATVDGASTLSNGTINSSAESPSCIGSGVAARDFIIARSARVDTGANAAESFCGGRRGDRKRIFGRSIRFSSLTAIVRTARPVPCLPGLTRFRITGPRC